MLSTRHGQVAAARSRHAERIGPEGWHLRSIATTWLWLILLIIASTGCNALPQIDPTGSSIFLPSNNPPPGLTTSGNGGLFPTPAFQAPAIPPPCVQGFGPGCGGPGTSSMYDPVGTGICSKPGDRGAIMMTPLRVVAPVGGEVVMLAGICGSDGYLVAREPIEWMLSPDSVGQFVEVGDDAKGKLISHSTPKVEKLDVDFARGRTSAIESLINRGSPTRADDLILKKGQTWISLSSPSPGTSFVTALAPDSKIWDKRRVTAIIHWVEGSWQFPQPQERADREPAQLETLVSASEGIPARGWKVRYQSLNPNIALFSNGQDRIEIKTDDNGVAVSQLVQNNGATGSALIAMEVITPPDPQMKTPELVIARGQTLVTWLAPRLELNVQGPTEAGVGEILTYAISVSNPGQLPATAAQVNMVLPSGMEYVDSSAQPSSNTPSGATWSIGTLQPGEQKVINAQLRARSESPYRIAFAATAEPNLRSQGEFATTVSQPAIDLKIRPAGGATQVAVGEPILFEIDIANVSTRALTDLIIRIESDPGMVEANSRTNSVEQVIPVLQAGENRPIGVSFVLSEEGAKSARVTATSQGRLLASQTASITGTAPVATADQIRGQVFRNVQQASTGSAVLFTLQAQNRGPTLTNVLVNCDPDGSLQPQEGGGDGFDPQATNANQRLTWRLDRWESGEVKEFTAKFGVIGTAPAADVRFALQSAEAITLSFDGTVPIVGNNTTLPPEGGSTFPPGNDLGNNPGNDPNGAIRTGALDITILESGDPVQINSEVRYALIVRNNQNLPDSQVELLIKLPPGVDFQSVSSPFAPLQMLEQRADGTIRFEPIQSLREQEELRLTLRVVPRIAQKMVITALVRSAGQPQLRETTIDTTARN